MPTKKIADICDRKTCFDPEHNPPNMMVWEPGVYEHTCPGCGNKQRFVVGAAPTCSVMGSTSRGDNDWVRDRYLARR